MFDRCALPDAVIREDDDNDDVMRSDDDHKVQYQEFMIIYRSNHDAPDVMKLI